ncbi:MAG: LTA synthase family protein, partial [Actinomycetota bacterium]|nr:LTA synthase family protein [Actinomycetota bacterium]
MRVLIFLRSTFLSCRDWVYSLSLLVPFVVYNLALKAYDAASRPGLGVIQTLKLVRSDAFFNLGYSLLWVGLFAASRRGFLRRVAVFLFHVVTILMALVRAVAHLYFRETGTTLDYDIIALWALRYDEIKPMLKLPLLTRILLVVALSYATLGPWLLARNAGRWRGWPENPKEDPNNKSFRKVSSREALGLCLCALGLGSLSLLSGTTPSRVSKSFTRDPFINLIVTGVEQTIAEEDAPDMAVRAAEHPNAYTSLTQTPRTERRNLVLIHLESARARSVTPYNEDLKTTPFLDELAKKSLLAEQAYIVIPNTLKAIISVNCGVEPPLRPGTEAKPGGASARGLAELLKGQGYDTVFFQSSTENFENFRHLAKNLGYEEYYPLESMNTEGFERSNYFGYEDNVMLGPSEQWLRERNDNRPFVAKYLTGTAHHDYLPPKRYGHEDFTEDDRLNRYHNCLRYLDFFVKNLMDQYKKLGLYEDTIFVLYGDHGEGF